MQHILVISPSWSLKTTTTKKKRDKVSSCYFHRFPSCRCCCVSPRFSDTPCLSIPVFSLNCRILERCIPSHPFYKQMGSGSFLFALASSSTLHAALRFQHLPFWRCFLVNNSFILVYFMNCESLAVWSLFPLSLVHCCNEAPRPRQLLKKKTFHWKLPVSEV